MRAKSLINGIFSLFHNLGASCISYVYHFGRICHVCQCPAGFENSPRPLVFTSASGCRASEKI